MHGTVMGVEGWGGVANMQMQAVRNAAAAGWRVGSARTMAARDKQQQGMTRE